MGNEEAVFTVFRGVRRSQLTMQAVGTIQGQERWNSQLSSIDASWNEEVVFIAVR
jgi:hypothetical protein